MGSVPNSKIESLGVYLPEQVLSTEELMSRCRHRPRLDFERITGIRERRVAVGEYAVDLAVKAARQAPFWFARQVLFFSFWRGF